MKRIKMLFLSLVLCVLSVYSSVSASDEILSEDVVIGNTGSETIVIGDTTGTLPSEEDSGICTPFYEPDIWF